MHSCILRELHVQHVMCGNISASLLPKPKERPPPSTLPACPTTEGFRGPLILRRLSSVKTAINLTRKTQYWSMANHYRIPTVNGKTAYGDKVGPLARIAICRVDDTS